MPSEETVVTVKKVTKKKATQEIIKESDRNFSKRSCIILI
jgi:hypothetical protein